MKEKNDKLGFIEMKNFCFAKDNIERIRRQAMNWEKILAKDTSGKGLLSKINKELLKLNNKETNNLILKWTKNFNRHFTKSDIQLANKKNI